VCFQDLVVTIDISDIYFVYLAFTDAYGTDAHVMLLQNTRWRFLISPISVTMQYVYSAVYVVVHVYV